MSKKTFLYCRVSTDQQSNGLEAQSRALTDYCRLNKIENYELFADEGISDTKSSRPALDRMMAMVKNNEADCVVVYSFSRFARSTTHMLNGLEIMKAHGCNFCSLTEKIDTNSPIGKAVFVIISAIAALERDLIAERVKNGLANARAKGKLIGRKKLRDSELIRKLLKAGLSYRNVSTIAKCSHGSVHAEKLAMKKEELARLAKLEADRLEQEKFMAEQTEATAGIIFPEAA
jgi:DNA invertase Pin-like site-specific DNA recombinase